MKARISSWGQDDKARMYSKKEVSLRYTKPVQLRQFQKKGHSARSG
jgi:hypothetical protein